MATPVTTVRPRRAADLPGAVAALVSVHASDGYPVEGVSDPAAWLRPRGEVAAFVAEADGRVAGHAAVVADPGTAGQAVLVRLFVVREARGMRLGEELVRSAEAYAREHGLRLVLDVLTKDTAAIRLYERLGWSRTGAGLHAYGAGLRADVLHYAAPGAEGQRLPRQS